MLLHSLCNIFMSIDDDTISYRDLRRISKGVQDYFNGTIPKKYLIFPQKPYIYLLSKSVCIEVPSYGNKTYRHLLYNLEKELSYVFQFDVELFNGNTTFVIKGIKDELIAWA